MIETERLELIPLTTAQLGTALDSIKQFSTDLGLPVVEDLLDGKARQAVEKKLVKMKGVSSALLPWYTYWLIVIKEEDIAAGMVGFKGPPNSAGVVEIGYGISPIYQGCGYMTDAVNAMIDWAFSHPECKSITATAVDPENIASRKVLVKSGFVETDYCDEGVTYMRVPG